MNHTVLYSKRICNHLIQIESNSLKNNLKDIEFHARIFSLPIFNFFLLKIGTKKKPSLITYLKAKENVFTWYLLWFHQ